MRSLKFLMRLVRNEQGATAVEYGLIVSLVVIACIGAIKGVANENTGLWAVVSHKVSVAM